MTFADQVIRRRTPPRADRFAPSGRAPAMAAVVTTTAGGFDALEYREVPRPLALEGELLVSVLAAGVNATDLNTRSGWYVATEAAGTAASVATAERDPAGDGGGWQGPTPFPLIQGADCCGRVVATAPGGDSRLVGRRVLVRPCMRPSGFGSLETVWMGTDFDGAFAQYVSVPASEVFAVDCAWSDAELGAVPCAYGTAENMLRRAAVRSSEHVLVTGASGGVGAAVVQLAKRRGALVTAVTSAGKADAVRAAGADHVLVRAADPAGEFAGEMGGAPADVVVDNVSGPAFGALLGTLKRGGRYVSSGAIAGPLVELRQTSAVPQGPHPAGLYGVGRAGVRRPGRGDRAGRVRAPRRPDVPARADRRRAARLPRRGTRRQARARAAAGQRVNGPRRRRGEASGRSLAAPWRGA